jgi:hypothetical protein
MSRRQTFTCAECQRTFPLADDEEAWKEAVRRFGPQLRRDDCKLVCGECYPLLEPVH